MGGETGGTNQEPGNSAKYSTDESRYCSFRPHRWSGYRRTIWYFSYWIWPLSWI